MRDRRPLCSACFARNGCLTIIRAVTPEFLHARGVKLLLSDLDFTLAPKKQSEPDEALKKWIDGLQAAGITFAILSNNRSGVRVEKFCKPLGIGYVGHAGKPSTRGFQEAMARSGAGAGETAMLGDKLLTDTLGARRSGVLMLMVEPKGGRTARGTMCCMHCRSRSKPQARTTSGKNAEICKFHPQHQEKHLHCRTICGKIP